MVKSNAFEVVLGDESLLNRQGYVLAAHRCDVSFPALVALLDDTGGVNPNRLLSVLIGRLVPRNGSREGKRDLKQRTFKWINVVVRHKGPM